MGRGILVMSFAMLFLNIRVRIKANDRTATSIQKPNTIVMEFAGAVFVWVLVL